MCCEVRWFLLMLVVDDFVITVNITNECKKHVEPMTNIIIFVFFYVDGRKCCIFVDMQ